MNVYFADLAETRLQTFQTFLYIKSVRVQVCHVRAQFLCITHTRKRVL